MNHDDEQVTTPAWIGPLLIVQATVIGTLVGLLEARGALSSQDLADALNNTCADVGDPLACAILREIASAISHRPPVLSVIEGGKRDA